MAHALEYLGDDDMVETIIFIKMFDRFFDCLNVRCLSEGVQKRKPDLQPYTDPCDSRLKVSTVFSCLYYYMYCVCGRCMY